MTDLAELVDSLRREVAVPGTFDAEFPNTSADDLVATLADGLCEAQLDGWMRGVSINLDAYTTSPDLSQAGRALVVIYSGIRIVRNQLKNVTSHTRYESAGNVFERDRGAGLLKEALSDLNQRRKDLLTLRMTSAGTTVYTRDGYAIRAHGFYRYELGFVHQPSLLSGQLGG